MPDFVNTHNVEITFGKHKGKLWTRIPAGYLRWMCGEFSEDTEAGLYARSELNRRGAYEPSTISVSMHALDRASQRLLDWWAGDVDNREPGLATWTLKLAEAAYEEGEPVDEDQEDVVIRRYEGFKWVFTEGEYPKLKTIK